MGKPGKSDRWLQSRILPYHHHTSACVSSMPETPNQVMRFFVNGPNLMLSLYNSTPTVPTNCDHCSAAELLHASLPTIYPNIYSILQHLHHLQISLHALCCMPFA